MTASVLQEIQADASGSGASLGIAFGSNNTAGSAIHALATWSTTVNDLTSFTDSRNTYATPVDFISDSGDNQSTGHSHADNIGAGANTVTANFSNTPSFRGIWIREIGGVTATPLDGHSSQFQGTPGTGTDAISSGTATDSVAPVLMSGLSMNNGNTNAPNTGTGFTLGANAWGFGGAALATSEHQRFTTTATRAATFTAGVAGEITMTLMMMFDESAVGDVLSAQASL